MGSERVVIGTRFAPTYHGGLAGSQRKLAELVTRRTGHKGTFVATEPGHPRLPRVSEPLPWPLVELPTTALGRAALPVAPRLASRGWTHGLLDHLLAHAWDTPRDLTPTAIHFVGTGWDFAGCFFLAWARRLGVPFTMMPAVHAGMWGDDRVDIRLYQKADAVFAQTQEEWEHLARLGVPAQSLRRIAQTTLCREDGDGARFRRRHGLGERPTVLFLARRDEGKGFPALLAAWPLVLKSRPDAVLLIAGPGAESDAFASLPEDSFRDLGVVDEQEKADALAACTIFCLPSSHESFGIAYVEAWLYGKPVICGPAIPTREIVPDGVAGLWSSQEPADIAANIGKLLGDPALARAMGEEGRKLQREKYSDDQFVGPFLEAIS